MTSLPSNLESERKALVKRVWDQCWEEFQSWKAKFASEEIAAAAVGRPAALQVKLEQDSQPDVAPPATDRSRFDFNEELQEVPLSSGTQLLTVWSFPVPAAGESGDIVPNGHRIPVYPCDPIKDVAKPVAPYESCVLLSQNVQVTDTAAEFEVMEFMPFGNEAAFRRKNPDFLKDEETGGKRFTFKWDMPDRDPDIDVVMCEAARRLHTDHGLSFGEIDSAEILPRSLVMDDGSIWNPFTLRTVLPWPAQRLFDTRPTFKELTQSITNLSTEQRLLRIANLMCTNLGCIQPACPTHGLGSQPYPKRIRPTITQMVEACEEPCGPDCFQTRDRQSSGLILWSDTELHELGDVWDSWNAGSGLSVCMLSRMVFKPCWEVFEKLHAVEGPFDLLDAQESGGSLSDHQVYEDTRKRLRFDAHRRGNDYELSVLQSVRIYRIAESSPTATLPVITRDRAKQDLTASVIELSCAAKGIAPVIRRVVAAGKVVLAPNELAPVGPIARDLLVEMWRYVLAGRRCHTFLSDTRCGPYDLDFKRTRVVMRDYEWGPGWGLELAEPATKEEFIDGEVIGEIEADFRSLEAEYLNRNYMFGLDTARSIDSARASNETRVINHAGDKKDNLVAEVRFVDEEPRIAFFAGRRIEAGEELFFNYGQEFFGKSKASGSGGKKK